MDDGRKVEIDPVRHPHLDHGYAVTSHSSQGQTANRVLIHVDTELGAKDLLNNRMAYVAVSRGAYDAQIFTSNRNALNMTLGRDVSHRSAHAPAVERQVQPAEKIDAAAEHERHYAPLRRALEAKDAAQFQWKAETGTIQTYQHIETGKNIHIESVTGQFFRQDGQVTSQEAALDRAMPEAPEHARIEYGYGLGIGR